jgi:hypothetical protein
MAARWTPDEDCALRALYATQRPVKDIATRLGRTPDAVTARPRQIGLAPATRPGPHGRTPYCAPPSPAACRPHGSPDGCHGPEAVRWLAAACPRRPSPARKRRGAGAAACLSDYAPPWSAADDALLTRLTRARTPLLKVARTLVRTPEAVRRRCRRLGFVPPPAPQAAAQGTRGPRARDALLRLRAGVNTATRAERPRDHLPGCAHWGSETNVGVRRTIPPRGSAG